MTWISVEDRLPEEGDVVLVIAARFVLTDGVTAWSQKLEYIDRDWRAVVTFHDVKGSPIHHQPGPVVVAQEITHWMPLPEPPKE